MVLMRGAKLVRKGIADYLRVAVPEQRLYALGQWHFDRMTLPPIDRIEDYPITDIRHADTVTLSVGIGRANNFTRLGYTDRMEEEYEVRYTARVYVAITTPDGSDGTTPDDPYAYAVECRDDMVGLVRSAILTRPTLGNPAFNVNENSLSEDYSEVVGLKGGRFSSAGYLSFDLSFDESQYRPILGTADRVVIETAQLPREG